MWILLAVLLLPLVEIAGFVVVGSHIGVFATLLLVIASTVFGAAVLRRAGLRAIQTLRGTVADGRLPSISAVDSAYVMLAGILLIVPGFVTDIAALLILVPPIRDYLVEKTLDYMSRRVVIVHPGPGSGSSPTGAAPVIEGEFSEVDPKR